MHPILKDLIRKLGIESPQVIQGLANLISKIDGSDPGTWEETTYVDGTGIHHIKFEKIGAKTHSLVTRPPISNRDQKALVQHLAAHQINRPDEIQDLINGIRALRKGEQKGCLLLSVDGTTPILMQIRNDKLVFESDPRLLKSPSE